MPILLQQPCSMNTPIVSHDGKHSKIYFRQSATSPVSLVKQVKPCKLRRLKSCDELAGNPIFLHRFNVAATQIQKVVRGRCGRQAALQTERENRQQHKALLMRAMQVDAATKIQAITRGAMLRSHFACRRLELQLHRIESAKLRELAEIEAQKKHQLRLIKADFEKKRSILQKKAKKQQADFDMAKKIINYLRAENKKLREKNEALRVAIQNMVVENKLLSSQSNSVSLNSEKLSCGMMHVNDQNAFLKSLLKKMEGQIEAFQEAILLRDDAIMTENRMGRCYFNSIQSIVLAIDDTSDDAKLVDEMDDLYSKMYNGRGLEETERDLTENFA